MNKILKTLTGGALALAMFTVGQAHAVPTFTLDPVGGAISGAPGASAGWGFTLTNDTSDYLVVSSTEFQPATGLGTYEDFLGPQYLEVGPTTTFTQAFDLAGRMGVGSFFINPGAHIGALASGRILLTYDLYSLSTLVDPSSLISSGNLLSANAAVSPVPEPATWLLLGAGCAGLVTLRRRPQFC